MTSMPSDPSQVAVQVMECLETLPSCCRHLLSQTCGTTRVRRRFEHKNSVIWSLPGSGRARLRAAGSSNKFDRCSNLAEDGEDLPSIQWPHAKLFEYTMRKSEQSEALENVGFNRPRTVL